MIVAGLALFFDYSNGFHDATNVVATIIGTGAMRPRPALGLAALCHFIGPFLFGTARVSAVRWGVAKNIVVAWFVTIPASAVMAGLSFFLIRVIHPHF